MSSKRIIITWCYWKSSYNRQ